MNEPSSTFSSCNQEGMSVAAAQRATVIRSLAAALWRADRRAPS